MGTGRLTLAKVIAIGAILCTFISLGGVASAADTTFPNADYGFDGNANLIVGGGAMTLQKLALGFAQLYDTTTTCETNIGDQLNPANTPPAATPYPQASPAFNQCSPTSQTYSGVNAGGNYDDDSVTLAGATSGDAGMVSLNNGYAQLVNGTVVPVSGTFAYEGTNGTLPTSGIDTSSLGTTNGYGTVDFALADRAARTSPASFAACPSGNELTCDTFWGVAADGVQVFTWGSTMSGTTDSTSLGANTLGFTPTDLFNIYECIDTTWGQLSQYSAAVAAGDPVPPSNAPIVPWSMNARMGMYADFNNYVSGQTGNPFTADDHVAEYSATNPGGSATSPTPPAGSCARELSSTANPLPLENDVKPLLEDVQANQGGLNQSPLSTNNPANWIWFGSNGLLTANPGLSQPSLFGNSYTTNAQLLNGTAPSPATIGAGTYPAEAILNLVTRSTDATCPLSGTTCVLTGGPVNANGTTDLNVLGGTGGPSGAVREFIRFLCRTKAENTFTSGTTTAFSPTDPDTNAPEYNEIGALITSSGFTLPPTAVRSSGSNCDVQAA